MENIEKNMEDSDIQEEIKIENTIETSENSEEDAFDTWVKKHIGEKNVADAFKLAVKSIRSAGQFKLKHIVYPIKYIGYAMSFALGILALYGICYCFAHIFDMMTGDTDAYYYHFFDSDLWCTIIASVIASTYSFSLTLKNRFVKGLLYFIFLMAVAEYWDYSFLETYDTNSIFGKICFWLFFVIIPILLIVKDRIEDKDKKSKKIVPKEAEPE
jgi:hypothetical protein